MQYILLLLLPCVLALDTQSPPPFTTDGCQSYPPEPEFKLLFDRANENAGSLMWSMIPYLYKITAAWLADRPLMKPEAHEALAFFVMNPATYIELPKDDGTFEKQRGLVELFYVKVLREITRLAHDQCVSMP